VARSPCRTRLVAPPSPWHHEVPGQNITGRRLEVPTVPAMDSAPPIHLAFFKLYKLSPQGSPPELEWRHGRMIIPRENTGVLVQKNIGFASLEGPPRLAQGGPEKV